MEMDWPGDCLSVDHKLSRPVTDVLCRLCDVRKLFLPMHDRHFQRRVKTSQNAIVDRHKLFNRSGVPIQKPLLCPMLSL